jgi:O-antigen ligase
LLLVLAIAAAAALAERAEAGYFVDVWGPLGLGLVALAAVLVITLGPPGRWTALAALALSVLAVWAAISPLWGGLPDDAWSLANQCVIGAAALLAGSIVGRTERRADLVLLGLLVAGLAQAAEVLVRLAFDGGPTRWLVARVLEGPVGYTNAQGLVFVSAVPLALRLADAESARRRAFGGFAGVCLLSATFLTQSRGSLLALAIAAGVQLLWTRSLRGLAAAAALAVSAAVLVIALRTVDSSLLEGSHGEAVHSLRFYLLWTILLAAGVALLGSLTLARVPLSRTLAAALVALLAVGIAAAAVAERGSLAGAAERPESAAEQSNTSTGPGSTRLLSLSLSGRRQTWRVAWNSALDSPLHGDGAGQFTRDWTLDRGSSKLYVRQPHSILLELASELGFVGLTLFLAFLALAFISLAGSRHSKYVAAAGAASLVVVVVDASVDFTWSFVSLVAAALVAVGASAGAPQPAGRVDVVARVAIALGALGLLVSIGSPYLAGRRIESARALVSGDPRAAYSAARSATSYDPWSPEAYMVQGQAAERAGEHRLAARRYARAAELSRRPWPDYFAAARARHAAGDPAGTLRACLAAGLSNPGEPRLQEKPCSFPLRGGVRWPVVPTRPSGSGARSSNDFAAYFKDAGCGVCALRFHGRALDVTAFGTVFRDTVYGEARLGDVTGWTGSIDVRADVAIEAARLDGELSLIQLRGRYLSFAYEISLSPVDGRIHLYSPSGNLDSSLLYVDTGYRPRLDGTPFRIEIRTVQGREVTVRINGKTRVRLGGLDGAVGDRQRYLRAGVLAYTSDDPHQRVRVTLEDVGASQSGSREAGG